MKEKNNSTGPTNDTSATHQINVVILTKTIQYYLCKHIVVLVNLKRNLNGKQPHRTSPSPTKISKEWSSSGPMSYYIPSNVFGYSKTKSFIKPQPQTIVSNAPVICLLIPCRQQSSLIIHPAEPATANWIVGPSYIPRRGSETVF